jgi:3-hydroxyisobutyrate dehydrogenase
LFFRPGGAKDAADPSARRNAVTDAAPKPGIAFIGLGQMGLPMATRLVAAGFPTRGADLSAAARAAFAALGGAAFADPAEAAWGAEIVITMLPDGAVVRDALLGDAGIAEQLPKGSLIIDMSSSAPLQTAALGLLLAEKGLRFIDAPVSGGVRKAANGTLSIMAGGPAEDVARARPILLAMGSTVFATGPLGSGHAMKALNNYVSAAGLAAAAEAVEIGRRFGLDPEIATDVLNASTGRNNTTEVKMKPFMLSGAYDSGFSLALMAKDLNAAAEMSRELGLDAPFVAQVAALWAEAKAALPPDADHTAIHRWLKARIES